MATQVRIDARVIFRWMAATLAAGLATALLAWMRANSTAAGVIFLLLVVWLSTVAGRWLALYTALLCALSFDYFFLAPARSLSIAEPRDWMAMLTFTASCVVVSRVAERARLQARQAEQRREDVERLYELSQQMLLHEDAAGLIRDLPGLVDRIFALDGVILYVADQDRMYSSGVEPGQSVQASLRAAAQTPGAAPWAPDDMAVVPLSMGMRAVGALGWRPAARLPREVATAVGGQVAIALAHSVAMEASARLEASREGERLRTALIDSLTHELRTPLTSIRVAATTLIEGGALDESARRDLAALVDEEAARLDALIGEAVEMAEIDANVLRPHLVQQHPRELLEQTVEQSRALLRPRKVTIEVEDESPNWLDPHLLTRVLRHLLENAARYTPPETRIRLRCWRAGDRLEFSVEDDGPGIDTLDMPLIFERFYRGKRSAEIGKGTGMGLAIARAILAAHGGGIEASSAPGQGARFRFWVPVVEKEPV